MTPSEKIDAYIENAAGFAQPILRHVRALVHEALPEAQEAVKWGVPYFTVHGKNAVGMAAFKAHASVIICSDETAGGGMGNFGKLTSLEELPDDVELMARFRESAQAVQSSKTSQPKPKPVLATPEDLPAAIAAFGADIDDVVGGLDDVKVVLDHHDRVPLLDQFVQHL